MCLTQVLTKTGADQGVMKKAIDLKQALEHARDKVSQLKIIRMTRNNSQGMYSESYNEQRPAC